MATPQKNRKKYVRPPQPPGLMNMAIKKRSVEDLIWSLISLAHHELKDKKTFETLSANHLVSLIDQLVKLEKQRPEGDPKGVEDEANSWLRIG
jgi:hypothetical protein